MGAWRPKETGHRFFPIRDVESADAVYLPRSECESEDEDMCVVSDDGGPAPGPFNRISTNDWDEE